MNSDDLMEFKSMLAKSSARSWHLLQQLLVLNEIIDENYSDENPTDNDYVLRTIALSINLVEMLEEECDELSRIADGCVGFMNEYKRSLEILYSDEKKNY